MKLVSLIAVALFSGLCGCTSVSIEKNNRLSPKATAAVTALSYSDIPDLKEAFIDTAPSAGKDGIPVGKLGIDGGNKATILSLAKEIAANEHGRYDSLLISHRGKLLFESYYLRGRINLPHYQASATKAYTSLALGRAIQMGYLSMADLDKPLVNFLKDLDPTKFVDGAEKVTLHQAMTMRSGLRFSAEQLKEFEDNPNQFNGLGQIQAFFELSAPVTAASQSYKYDGASPTMVMQVLDAVVPGTARDFINNELLGKIGITEYSWRNDLSGLPSGGGGSSLTSRDMLKLGALINNKGQWNGEQLISARYLDKATSNITKPTEAWQPDSFGYGYFWYQTDLIAGAKKYEANIAWGGGGQRILAVEELDLVVAITGHDREDTIMIQVSKAILPAFAH